MARLDRERQARLEPERIAYAVAQLEGRGLKNLLKQLDG